VASQSQFEKIVSDDDNDEVILPTQEEKEFVPTQVIQNTFES
jgi:hypothetical protein